MKIIVITRPGFSGGETGLVNDLFRSGLERLHLRKPGASGEQLEEWLKGIDRQYYDRIVLHDCHGLAMKYGLGGVHLNSRNPEAPHGLADGMTVSRSCHSFDEVARYKDSCSYLFLSPIYDSISKEGYGAAFSSIDLERAAGSGIIDRKVFALGGISAERIPEIRSLGFGGAAVLGALWQAAEPVEYLQRLLQSNSL